MANGVFNIAKGAAVEKVRDDNTKLVVILLKAAEADAVLEDYDDISALLGAAGNIEADFTNYARKSTTDTDGTVTVDDTNNNARLDMADLTWASAGGASNNTLVKMIIAYNQGAGDANLIPLVHLDFAVTTDGTDVIAQFDADGFFRAA